MGNVLVKSRLRKAMRNDATVNTKLRMVQEAQIAQLEIELKATQSVLLAVTAGNYDVVDPYTGEVHKVFWR